MRTTITLDDNLHQVVSHYARAKGVSFSAAVAELIRKGEDAPEPQPDIRVGPNGIPMFPPVEGKSGLTDELVRRLEEEAFDPKAFA